MGTESINIYHKAAELIKSSTSIYAFTGAGISVESGIPPFRGLGGLWQDYDPNILDLDTYINRHEESWPIIKKLFFDFFGEASPNDAHLFLSQIGKSFNLKGIITQNIDNLHQEAGSRNVIEFHGNSQQFVCMECGHISLRKHLNLTNSAPLCLEINCNGLLKPDFVFFGEGIPDLAYQKSLDAASESDLFIIIGTTGEIFPASHIPIIAKQNGARIIEINIQPSAFTHNYTDLFIQEKASIAMKNIFENL